MCGIAGFYSINKSVSKEDLVQMTDLLAHRGPDARGFYFNNYVGLGHRRLSILDLSDFANQPMYSKDGKFVIVFNGEIYNYKELAREWNLTLSTTSDTEVLLEGFAKYGIDVITKLNGMYVFVIYDIAHNQLFVCRDRLGVKPLYYSWDNGCFLFASELKSIQKITNNSVSESIDTNAIVQFLRLGYIPAPNSIFKNIKKFPAGHYCVIGDGELKIIPYWNAAERIAGNVITDYSGAKEKLKALLESSVSLRLNSDVPFGVFLSGGIDSSTVAAISQKLLQGQLKTFSIGFKEGNNNEAEYAKAIAKYLNTEHFEYYLTQEEAISEFEKIMDNFDEPYADTSAIPTYMVSRLASEHVTMVLTGDGGDELFMGYGAYSWADRLLNPIYHKPRKGIATILGLMPQNRSKRAAKLFEFDNLETIHSHIFSQEQYFFSERELKILLNEAEEKLGLIEKYNVSRTISSREKQALFDINYYLQDDLLVKVDRTSMKCSIEAREPLLDYRLVEFALNLSEELKVKNNITKYLLKEVLFDYIPSSYFERPKKGFSIPLALWLNSGLKYLIEDYLSREVVHRTGLFKYEYIESLKNKFYKGETYLYNRLFILAILNRWLINNKYY